MNIIESANKHGFNAKELDNGTTVISYEGRSAFFVEFDEELGYHVAVSVSGLEYPVPNADHFFKEQSRFFKKGK